MPDIPRPTLQQAERLLTMNLSILAMLKGNTSDEAIADFREQWVTPLEEWIRDLKSGSEGVQPG